MKLISEYQQAKIRLRYEVIASALLSTLLISVTVFLTSPVSYGLMQQAAI